MSPSRTPARPRSPLVTLRDLRARAVERAVGSLRLPAGAWVLDAGTGAGGALPWLARAAGKAGRVHAVDLDPAAVLEARSFRDRHAERDQIRVEHADVVDVVRTAATDPAGGFDVIWAADLVDTAHFRDPATAVATLTQALRPHGLLTLFATGHRDAVLLPGHARLERVARAALDRHSGRDKEETPLRWLHRAGLERVQVDVFPLVVLAGGTSPVDRAAQDYLAATAWPMLRDAALACGPGVGMTPRDLVDLLELTSPDSPRYAPDEPGWYMVLPAVLVSGRRSRHGHR